MNATVKKIISSYWTTIVLLCLYALLLAIATFIEKYHGTPAAKSMVYYSPFFFLLQFLMVVNFIAAVIEKQLLNRKKWGFLLLHVSFIIILCGAMVSHIFGEEGILHLREGENSNQIVIQTSKETRVHTLPFSVELLKFTITRYPGSSSPSSYESELLFHVDGKTLNKRVFMNNVVDLKGYRFFQASYDRDEQGTILSVNKDVAGRNITYAGYLLLCIGFILSLLEKNSRFRILNRQLKTLRDSGKMMILLLLLSFSLPVVAQPGGSGDMLEVVQRFSVRPEHAANFGSLAVQSGNGRMMPVNTFSSEILRKIHRAEKIGDLNSDQFLISLLTMPDMWMRVPFIVNKNKELALYYDLSEGQMAYMEVFDTNGNYKFQEKLEEAYTRMPAERSGFDKDLIKLDEKVNILFELFNYQMLNLFPLEGDANNTWYAPGDDLSLFEDKDSLFVSHIMTWYLSEIQESLQTGNWNKPDEIVDMIRTYQEAKGTGVRIDPKKIEAELRYNRLNIFRYCKIFYLILGGILLVVTFSSLFKPSSGSLQWTIRILWIAVMGVFIFQMYGMAMRWYIGGYAPWSNSYETMVYVAWATVLGGLMFMRRSTITFALATLFGGIVLFVSGLNWMDPQINTLVPVLKSPWLMFHVAVIVAAYGFFGISFLIGFTNLCLMSFPAKKEPAMLRVRIRELTIANEMSLLTGLALMTIGTFLGAVWANESWGRYWGWDPKETWALITVIVYAVILHLRLIKSCRNSWLFNLCSILGFASVLMTYFGVNYFLSGMHSYGQNDQMGGLFTYLYIAIAVIVILAIVANRGYKKLKNKTT